MRVLLYIFGFIISIILLALVVAFFLPSRLQISRETVINETPEGVFSLLNDVANFNTFSPWYSLDTTATFTYSENTQGLGATLQWDSKTDLGQGTYTISESIPYKQIDVALSFGEGFNAIAQFILNETTEGTQVEWRYDAPADYPIGRYFGLFYQGILEKQYEDGLARLKQSLETQTNQELLIEVEEIQQEALPVMSVRANYGPEDDRLSAMGNAFTQVVEYVQRLDLDMEETRFVSIYFNMDKPSGKSMTSPMTNPNERIEFMAGVISDKAEIKPNSGIEPYTIPAGVYLRSIHRGAYNRLSETHQALNVYIQKQEDKQFAGDVFEEYITNPEVELDTAQWITHVYYRVERLASEELGTSNF